MKNNKIIIIILTAVLCLMLAVGAFLIFSPDETKPADSQNASSAQSEASSSESVSSSEPADNGITLESVPQFADVKIPVIEPKIKAGNIKLTK